MLLHLLKIIPNIQINSSILLNDEFTKRLLTKGCHEFHFTLTNVFLLMAFILVAHIQDLKAAGFAAKEKCNRGVIYC